MVNLIALRALTGAQVAALGWLAGSKCSRHNTMLLLLLLVRSAGSKRKSNNSNERALFKVSEFFLRSILFSNAQSSKQQAKRTFFLSFSLARKHTFFYCQLLLLLLHDAGLVNGEKNGAN